MTPLPILGCCFFLAAFVFVGHRMPDLDAALASAVSVEEVCAAVEGYADGNCAELAKLTARECSRFTDKVCAIGFFEEGIRADGHALALGRHDNGDYWCADMGRYIECKDFNGAKKVAAKALHCEPEKLWWAVVWPEAGRVP